MRAVLDLGAPDRDAAVPVGRGLALAERLRAVGVAALADRQIGVLLAQRHGAVERRELRLRRHAARFWPRAVAILGAAAQHGVERPDVLGRGAAAAADDADPVLGQEALEPRRELARAERIPGPA